MFTIPKLINFQYIAKRSQHGSGLIKYLSEKFDVEKTTYLQRIIKNIIHITCKKKFGIGGEQASVLPDRK